MYHSEVNITCSTLFAVQYIDIKQTNIEQEKVLSGLDNGQDPNQ